MSKPRKIILSGAQRDTIRMVVESIRNDIIDGSASLTPMGLAKRITLRELSSVLHAIGIKK